MDKFLTVALEASKKAEKVVMKYYSPKTRATLKPDQTPVTIADKMAEKIIIETIKRKFPGHSFLGEEGGENNCNEDSEYQWIIDPIDGTKNYIRQIPFFGIQIALMKNGEIITGVSNVPVMKEIMYASKGKGAYLNGKRVHVSKISNFKDTFVCYGNLKYFEKHKCLEPLLRLARECRYTREYGDCWMYHLVAQGKIEMALEAENKIWDVAASKIIIEEAGGKFTEFSGKKLTKNSISGIGTNGILHSKVLKYFNK
jgi:histidinol-phosphatase